nr:DNA polymerase Y family protein [Hyphomicrobium methylovorum]
MRIFAVDRHAARLGLAPGLALADARARIPQLTVADRDAKADAWLIERLELLCERYTPTVAFDHPNGLILDVTGCAHLWNGEAGLRTEIIDWLARQGFEARATIAGTPDASRALARFSRTAIVREGEDERAVSKLPVTALAGLERETIVALTRAGLKTIGDVAARPPQVLAARFGQSFITQLHRTLSQEIAPLAPLRPEPVISVERRFAEPLSQTEALEAVLADLIAEAARALEARDEGGRTFEASFFRSDGHVRRLTVETGRPSREAATILKLYRERLDTLAEPIEAGFGFDVIRLTIAITENLIAAQSPLMNVMEDARMREMEAVGALIDRLIVRFGRDRVLRFETENTHNPSRADRLVPADTMFAKVKAQTSWTSPEAGEPPLRPHHLFDPPQPIEALAEVPDGPPRRFRWRRMLHDVVRAEGPERIAPEWWRKAHGEPDRDYYRVEDAMGCRFWIFRQGLYGEGQAHPPWFIHGLFA